MAVPLAKKRYCLCIASSKIGEEVVAFRKFMKLAPETSTTADLTVIKGLLTSNGNTNRD